MIRLERFDHTDYDKLISWVDSAESLMQFAGPAFTFPLTKEQLDISVADPCRYAFKVIDATDVIGYAELYVTEGSIYLGRILIGDKTLRGQGIGQQIVAHLLTYAFTKLEATIAQLNVFDWNTAAIKCYQKAGFTINPEKQLERTVNGQTWIALNMVLSKKDWLQKS